MKIATKKKKKKNIYSQFSISRFLKEYDYPEYLIIGQNEFKKREYLGVFNTIKEAKNEYKKRLSQVQL